MNLSHRPDYLHLHPKKYVNDSCFVVVGCGLALVDCTRHKLQNNFTITGVCPDMDKHLFNNLFNITAIYCLPLVVISVSYCLTLYEIARRAKQNKRQLTQVLRWFIIIRNTVICR